jgi:hypothetical protein
MSSSLLLGKSHIAVPVDRKLKKAYEGSEMEVLATMKMYNLCGFNDDDDLEIETVIP